MVDSREGLGAGQPGNSMATRAWIAADANGSYSSAVYYRVGLIFALLAIAGCSSESPLLPQESARPRGVDLYVAGVQAYQAGDHKLAQDRFEQATQVNPSLEMARSMLGDIYRSQGDYDHARQQYEALVLLDPYTPDNYYRLGVTYQFLQRVEDAIGSYLRALDLDPRDMKSCMNLGLAYLSLNQRDDAIKYLRQATEISPTWADAWTNLGVALDAQGQLIDAAEMPTSVASRLDRHQSVAILNLGANLIRQGKGEQAVGVMEEALKRVDNAPTRTRYGHALILAGRPEDSIQQFDFAMKFDPRYYPALNERAYALITQYDKGLQLDDTLRAKAVDAWQQSLKLYPDQPNVQAALNQWNNQQLFGKPSS